MGRNLFAQAVDASQTTTGRNLLSQNQQETFEEKALRLGAKPGVALTQEQLEAIRRDESIDSREPSLRPRDYQQVPTGDGQPFVESAKQEARNIGAGILRAGGELINSLGIDGARQFLDELEASQAISQQQTAQATQDAPIQSFLGGVAGGTLAFPVGGTGGGILARLTSGAAAGATGGALSAAGRGEEASSIAEEAAIGGAFGGVAEALPFAIKARQAQKAKGALGDVKADIEDLTDIAKNIETAQQATRETGIGLLPSQQTQDIFQEEMTAFLGQNPEVSRKAFKVLNEQNSQAANAVNELLNKIAPSELIETAPSGGRRAAKALLDRAKADRKAATKPLYDDAFKMAREQGFKVDTSGIKSSISQMLSEVPEDGKIASTVKKAQKIIGDTTDLNKLQKAKFEIQEMIDTRKSGDTSLGNTSLSMLQRIKSELTDSLRQFEPFAAADDEFKRLSPSVDKIKDGVFGRIQDLADRDLRRVSKMIFDPNEINNATTVKNAVKSLKSVDGGEDIARGLLRIELENRLANLPSSLESMLESGRPENIPGQLRRMIFGNDKQQKMLFSALEEIDPKAANNAVWLKTALDRAKTSRPGGSQTGIRAEISKELRDGGPAGAIANFFRKPISSLVEMGEEARYNAKVRAVGEALYNADWQPDLNKIKKLGVTSREAQSQFEKLLEKIVNTNTGGFRTQAAAVAGRQETQEDNKQ